MNPRNELEKEQSQIKEYSNTIKNLATQIFELCGENSFIDQLQNTNNFLAKSVKEIKKKLADEINRNSSLEASNKYYETRVRELDHDRKELIDENEKLHENIKECEDEKNALSHRCQQYETKIKIQNSRIEEQAKTIKDQEETIRTIQSTIDNWENSSREQAESIRRIAKLYCYEKNK